MADLIAMDAPDLNMIKKALDPYMISPQDLPVFDAQDWIKHHFNHHNLTDIRHSLEGDSHPMAEACHHALDTRAPLSMAVTHHLMTHEDFADLSVPKALEWDNTMACRITLRPDFMEGVRALLIDKDNAPKWHPSSIDNVTSEMLDAIFQENDMMVLDYPQGYHP